MNASSIENHTWNRRVLYFYWMIAGLMLLTGEVIHLLRLYPDDWSGALFPPGLETAFFVLFACLLLSEILYRVMKPYYDFFLIGVGFAFGLVIMLAFGSTVKGLYAALDFPIIVSLFYFDRLKLRFAAIFTLFCYGLFYGFLEQLRDQITFYEMVALTNMVIGTVLIGHVMMSKAQVLLKSLEQAARSEMNAFAETIADENEAKYDHLTGLYNHITFQEYMISLTEQQFGSSMQLQLAVLDIDNFKCVNDTCGHHLGDIVLRDIADVLKDCISIDDVAARFGGEEFAIILTGKQPKESLALLEDIREQVAGLLFPILNNRKVTVSIGMSDFRPGMSKDALFREADLYLYEAKKSGKDRIVSAVDKEVLA
ncbi:diguanylate cyclase [Paenibacillus sp. R14(2021)]|uniref:GGDEF domain-containing protein n=1 Tax=Paenibacillus sp. R14(2021) TaxID=2859228 RepID=UPI001C6145D1|nr:GGDEF domain-containing protein [Paenibacillus sp. R14(2021)]